MSNQPQPPPISGVLETVLYVSDLDQAERFYSDVLGLRLTGKEPGRSLFYRAGSSVFLLFDSATTSSGQDQSLPLHGATGSIHTCFVVPEGEYVRWRAHLVSRGVTILKDARWERGESFYFHDPDGNLLEIANRDFWPR